MAIRRGWSCSFLELVQKQNNNKQKGAKKNRVLSRWSLKKKGWPGYDSSTYMQKKFPRQRPRLSTTPRTSPAFFPGMVLLAPLPGKFLSVNRLH